jgi:hypothetical protein
MTSCGHEPTVGRVCRHLLERTQGHRCVFTGDGKATELLCAECADFPGEMLDVCATCRDRAAEGGLDGIIGTPGIVEAHRQVRFDVDQIVLDASTPRFIDIHPIIDGDRAVWLGIADDGGVYRWEPGRRTKRLAQIPDGIIAPPDPLMVRVSRDGRLAAIANRRGDQPGVVLDLEARRSTLSLERSDYHPEQCNFSVAFVERAGRTLVVHAPDWNRLDVRDARTGEVLTARGPTSYARGEERPEHYLDYFHCELLVSPDQRYIADNGWCWHPVGVVTSWSIDRWLENVWESEDGPSRRTLCARDEWDQPFTWIDDTHLAVWGLGDDGALTRGIRVFDVTTGDETTWFAGPGGQLAFDRELASFGPEQGVSLWDVERGAQVARGSASVARYHPGAKIFTSLVADGRQLICRACGLDADAPWVTPRVRDVAHSIARDRSFHELPVLGDALQLAGCTDAEILAHCTHPGEHDDRCWVIDRLLVE